MTATALTSVVKAIDQDTQKRACKKARRTKDILISPKAETGENQAFG
jgi:hypothetical protein